MTQYEPPFTTPEKAVDVVAAVSYRSDGTPAQTEGYVVIGKPADTPADQAPADPAPVDPAPVDPAPADQAPVDLGPLVATSLDPAQA